MTEIKKKFFIFNPKSYLWGEALLEMAKLADELALAHPDISIFVTCPYADLYRVASQTEHIIVTAQHLDGIPVGRGMGAVLGESLSSAGAKATFLNHAEHPLTAAQLVESVQKAKKLGLLTIVCADSLEEARMIASLHPDIILCEPTALIGTGQTSGHAYMEETNAAVKAIDDSILMMQAAGISRAKDVYDTIALGADGTGCTSGIVKAENPKQMFKDMVEAVERALQDSERGL